MAFNAFLVFDRTDKTPSCLIQTNVPFVISFFQAQAQDIVPTVGFTVEKFMSQRYKNTFPE